MSLQELITKGKKEAIICTVLGEAGMGKTSFASTFQNPIFIRAEDGLGLLDVDALPLLKNCDDLWSQFKMLIHEEHDYKTVVIDSVTKLESMFIDYVVDNDPKKPKSINQAMGGYGAGLSAVASMHQRVRKASQLLLDKGINVVFIAHSDTETIELPDSDAYTKYNLRLGKRSVSPYVDDVDLVGFIKLETFTTGDGERKKAMSDGTRILVTYATAANVSKNRFGIEDDLVLVNGKNPLIGLIPNLK